VYPVAGTEYDAYDENFLSKLGSVVIASKNGSARFHKIDMYLSCTYSDGVRHVPWRLFLCAIAFRASHEQSTDDDYAW
jgi:hypothetical protein